METIFLFIFEKHISYSTRTLAYLNYFIHLSSIIFQLIWTVHKFFRLDSIPSLIQVLYNLESLIKFIYVWLLILGMVEYEGVWHYLDIPMLGQRLRRMDCLDLKGAIQEQL